MTHLDRPHRLRRSAARAPLMLALEPRFMFDGAAAVDVVATADATRDSHVETPAAVTIEPVAAAPTGRKEVAFIDTGVADYQALVDGVRAGVEVVLIDAGQSGLAQMAKWAETHSGYDAVHVLSHGSSAMLRLGADTITATSFDDADVRAELEALGRSLTPNGDLLVYGCSIATDAAGKEFVANLASVTGADLAASEDTTGSSLQSGDWVLEQSYGAIETYALGSSEFQEFSGSLVSSTITFEAGNSSSFTGATTTSISYVNTNITLTFTARNDDNSADGQIALGSVMGAADGHNGSESLYFVNDGSGKGSSFTATAGDGKTFDLTSFVFSNQNGSGLETFAVTTNKGGTFTFQAGSGGVTKHSISVNSDVANYQGISWFKITAPNGGAFMEVDDILLDNITSPPTGPSFTSATTANFNENATGTVYTAAATASSGGGAVTYSIVGGADQAKFTLTNGALTFNSSPNFESPTDADTNNTYVLTVRAADSNGNTDQTVTVTVANVNEAPTITSSASQSRAENGTAVATLTATDPDAGATQTWSIPGGGGADDAKFSISAGGALSFQSAPNFEAPTDTGATAGNNTYVVRVQVSDGTNTATQDVTVTVSDVNESPTAVDDTGSANETGTAAGSNATGTVTTNDTDPDAGATKTVTAIRVGNTEGAGTAGTVGQALAGTYGSLTLNSDGTYTYVIDNANGTVDALASGQTLTDSFNYLLSDGTNTDTAVLVVTINGANDAPTVGTNAGMTLNEGATATVTTALLSISDVDNAAANRTLTVGTAPANGTLYKSGVAMNAASTFTQADIAANSITYTHNGGETTSDSFTFTVADGSGGTIGSTTFSITVNAVDDAPAFTGLNGTPAFTEGGTAAVLDSDVTVSDAELTGSNYDGATLTIARNGGASSQDVYSSTGNLGTLTESGNLVLSGVTIGTVTTNSSGTLLLTFNTSATQARVNETLQSIRYSNSSDDPTASVQLNWTFSDGNSGAAQGSGGVKTGTGSTTVTVTGVNDAPTASITASNPTYTENGASQTLFSGATLSTVESGQTINSVVVTVGNLADGSAEKLVVDSEQIALTDGTTGTTATNSIGYSVSVTGSTATVTLTKTATAANWQGYLNALGYLTSSENPTTAGGRTVTLVSATDSGGTANGGAASVTINTASSVTITAVNDVPTLTNLNGDSVNFSVGGSAVSLDASSNATVADLDHANLNGGNVTVSITANGQTAEDVLGITNQGTAAGQIGASGGNVTYGGTTIGTYTGGSSGNNLVITLNANATPTAVQALVRALTYNDTDANTANTTSRTVRVTVNDGTGSSSNQDITVALVRAPIIDLDGDDSSGGTNGGYSGAFTENNGNLSIIDSDATLTDDGANLNQAVITLTNAQTGDILSLNGYADGSTTNGILATYTSSSVITLSGSGAKADYLTLLKAARFNNTSEAPNTTARSITFAGRDTDNNTGSSVTATISVTAVNDAPALSGNLALSAVSEDTAAPAGATITSLAAGIYSDPDNAAETINGLAIIGNTANSSTEGAWQYSTDGTNWNAIGTVADNSTALALSAATKLRFVPVANYNGTPTALSVRALDATYGAGWTSGATRTTVDTTTTGTTTAIAATARSVTTSITSVNDEPTLSATASSPNFTEGGTAVTLFSGAAISAVEAGQNITELRLTVTNVAGTGATESVTIDGTSVALTNGNTGNTATNTFAYSVALAGGTATVTITKTDTAANYQTLVNALAYRNTAADVDANTRVVTLTYVKDDGGTANSGDDTNSALAVASTVTNVNVNDEPTLTATAASPTYTENAATGAAPFSGSAFGTVESGQNITEMAFTVGNLADGTAETLTLDGSTITLTNGASGTTTGGASIGYAVSVTGSTATVTLTKTATTATWNGYLDGLRYKTTSDNPTTTGGRVFTITSVKDSGGTTNGGDDTNTATGVAASTVTITAVNDSPTVTAGGTATVFSGTAVAVDSGLTLADADSTNLIQAVITITNLANGASEALALTSAATTAAGNYGLTVGAYNAGAGTLTITGTATKAQYQEVLRGVTYANSASPKTGTSRTVSFVVRDSSGDAGTRDSAATNKTVSYNSSPTATGTLTPPAGQIGTGYGFTLPGGTFSDPDNDTLTYSATGLPPGVTINATTGALSGTPSGTGTFAVTITATDPGGLTATRTMSVTVNPAPAPAPPPPPPPPPPCTTSIITVPSRTTSMTAMSSSSWSTHTITVRR
ncbi:MAG: DUF4347 domain-containing protein [Alphaproteobacteria bacterium]|nr:DUF4347 domain-containing protein [Alphaproteobacteria bacterium]